MDTAFALGSTRLGVKLLPSCWGFPTTFKALIRRIKIGGHFSISFPFTSGGHAHPDDSDSVAAVELRTGTWSQGPALPEAPLASFLGSGLILNPTAALL